MSAWVVADSGLFIASVLNEDYSTQAEGLIKHWLATGFPIFGTCGTIDL